MIETGFAALLNTATGMPVFDTELPKDFVSASNPKAIAYRSITSTPLYTLDGQDPLTKWQVQINCCGFTAADKLALAKTINDYLSGGWRGTLTGGIVVQGTFRLPSMGDGFLDDGRTYVRAIEYQVIYIEQ